MKYHTEKKGLFRHRIHGGVCKPINLKCLFFNFTYWELKGCMEKEVKNDVRINRNSIQTWQENLSIPVDVIDSLRDWLLTTSPVLLFPVVDWYQTIKFSNISKRKSDLYNQLVLFVPGCKRKTEIDRLLVYTHTLHWGKTCLLILNRKLFSCGGSPQHLIEYEQVGVATDRLACAEIRLRAEVEPTDYNRIDAWAWGPHLGLEWQRKSATERSYIRSGGEIEKKWMIIDTVSPYLFFFSYIIIIGHSEWILREPWMSSFNSISISFIC